MIKRRMASFGEGLRLRPPDSKIARSPRAKTSTLKHKDRSSIESVKQSEESLRQLLEDFERGRLSAFGEFISLGGGCERLWGMFE